jgi:hypothetical protein
MECGCADRVCIQRQAPRHRAIPQRAVLEDRFGTLFQWADFYEAIAEKLLAYASNRAPLIQASTRLLSVCRAWATCRTNSQMEAAAHCRTSARSR